MIDVRLDDQPTPSGPSPPVPYVPPAPAPQPPPLRWPSDVELPPRRVSVPKSRTSWLVPVLIALNALLVVVVLAALFWRAAPRPGPAPGPAPSPTFDAYALGRQFSPVLGKTYADGWLAAAKVLEEGKTVAEAQKALQEEWKNQRTAEFIRNVTPAFEAVLPAGQEPDERKRAQVVQTWREFARGLKGEPRTGSAWPGDVPGWVVGSLLLLAALALIGIAIWASNRDRDRPRSEKW